MSDATICRYCGKPVMPNAIGGLCPECLLKAALASNAGTGASAAFVAPSVEDLRPHFPQLEILELIGRGGMGAVYKARQPELNRFVALKILPGEQMDANAGFAERFQREARALARLSHPNIVVVFEYGRNGPFHFLLMEFVEGVTLRTLLREGKLTPAQALAIVPQICEALQFAHDAGVVHRDIKPENMLIDKTGRVKVADFGLAKILAPDAPENLVTQAGHRMGTPHYMAPEQVEKPDRVDHRADIYSLGVVFYELLTGELPLGRFSPPSMRAQIDFRLDEVVLRALEKEPQKRWQQAREVKTEINRVEMAPVDARNPKGKWRAVAAALLLVMLGIPLFFAATYMVAGFVNQPKQQPAREQAEFQQRLNSGVAQREAENASLAAPADATLSWPQKIAAMNAGTWRQALATAEAIAELPPEEGWALVKENWGVVTNAESRKQFLKAFTFAAHPRLLSVLELGVLDQALPVQSWGLEYLKQITLRDMTEDYNAATKYLAERRDWTLEQALAESARELAQRLQTNNDNDLVNELKALERGGMFRRAPDMARNSGLDQVLEQIVETRSESIATVALEAAGNLQLPPEWHQRVTAPRLSTNSTISMRIAAAQALSVGRGNADWAVDALLRALADLERVDQSSRNSLTFAVGSALAQTGSKRAVEPVIRVIAADNTYSTKYGLGYFALTKLTGVPYEEKHDGPWWTNWWKQNRARFAE